ncbi:high affinity cationic amino acid transporter 1 isoform X2 [Anthonomus grandis grandis]|nr:high affinity cationic amino acid transporter 1 isoform X2 [Anthonomus grandis grandis]
MGRIWKVITRKKVINPVTAEETRLGRVLNVFDLTALGVGSTLGVGLFILAGQVAKDTAGPSVIISFVLAAIASAFAGLCYAEFGARVPRAGSAYIYSYVCVGEFIAFVIGWNLILEYIIGSASVARGISVYIDSLLNNTMGNAFKEIAPINIPYLSSYFDFFSFILSVVVSVGLAFGLKESSMVNNIVTVLNILVVLFIVVTGSLKADLANWQIPANTTNSTAIGNGGFFPFGVEGMIKGAATCFYAFVGFDCIATTGEEVANPRKAIPVSIITSLLIVFLAYFGVSTVLTLMVPYYLQDHDAPILKAFEAVGFNVAKWIIAIGAIFGLSASLFGAIFPLPRIIYAMGSDGLIFKFLAKIDPRFQSPVIGTIFAGLLTGLMSAIFDIGQLINMMSIGTLQAYTMVAASVLILRYKDEPKKLYIPIRASTDTESVSSESSIDEKYNDNGITQNFDGLTNDEQELLSSTPTPGFSNYLKQIFNCRNSEPNRVSESIVASEVFIYCIFCIGISLCIIYLNGHILNGELWAVLITCVLVFLTVLLLVSLATQPKSRRDLSFKVPLIPLIPALSIIINIYLMLMLDAMTWVRFGVWMVIGIPMYCACACNCKSAQKLQNGHYDSNIINGTLKHSIGGIANPPLVIRDPNGHQPKSCKKKVAPAPPPTIFETLEVQQEAVIAQLDEILDNEAAILQLEDSSNDEND